MADDRETTELMEAWYAGDARALERLLELHLDWIAARVRRRLGEALRARVESGDIVNETVCRLLRDGPGLRVQSAEHFRRLLARMVENVIRDQNDKHEAQCRSPERNAVPFDSQAPGMNCHPGDSPSQVVDASEMRDGVHLALALIQPEDRRVIVLRDWEHKSFAEIGLLLGVSPEAANMRHQRAKARLAIALTQIRSGQLEQLLDRLETDPPAA